MTSLHFIPVHSSYGDDKRAISAKGKNRRCNLSTPPHPPHSIFFLFHHIIESEIARQFLVLTSP